MGFIYETGRVMTQPRSCGKRFDEVSLKEIQEMSMALTPEEAASSCAKYYYYPFPELSDEHKNALLKALPDTYCYPPQEAGRRMIGDGYEKFENGYGVLPNGVGFTAVRIVQKGRNDKKVKYFREEFAKEGNLYYKAWYPGKHLIHFDDGAVEDFGWGLMKMKFSPREFNLNIIQTSEREIFRMDPKCIRVLGAGARYINVENPEKEEYSSMLMYDREIPGGREMRVRYWEGVLFRADGTIEIKLTCGKEEMLKRARLRAEHCMMEYTNENYLMDAFWKDRK